MKKKVTLFGRKVALSTILTTVLVVAMVTGAGAWAVWNAVGQVDVTTAEAEIQWTPSNVWVCEDGNGHSNEGLDINKCAATASGGPDVEFEIATNDFQVALKSTFTPTEQGLCVGIISTGTVPPELTIAMAEVLPARDLGDPTPIEIRVEGTPALGPGMSLEIPEIVIGTVGCP